MSGASSENSLKCSTELNQIALCIRIKCNFHLLIIDSQRGQNLSDYRFVDVRLPFDPAPVKPTTCCQHHLLNDACFSSGFTASRKTAAQFLQCWIQVSKSHRILPPFCAIAQKNIMYIPILDANTYLHPDFFIIP